MKTLYFDCFSGASGDMLLGALLDAGASLDDVRRALSGLGVDGWELSATTVTKGSVRATRASVTTPGSSPARHYRDIVAILRAAELPEGARRRALRAFEVLGAAEAHVHGTTIDEVHFHEVGALDAIVDVTGVMVALEHLAPDLVITSPVATGGGTIDGAHGPLPVPPPAVVEICAGAGIPIVGGGERELLTPTGAAILATITDRYGELPEMIVHAIGYGAGEHDLELPNIVRVLVGETLEAATHSAPAVLIETNIDDMNPEVVPFVIDGLMTAGAHDAWVTPITMKKGRPAVLLSILAGAQDRDRILDVVYRETTTFGARVIAVDKDVLERSWIEVEVAGHRVRVKCGSRGGQIVTSAPEFEDAAKVARATGLPLKEVYARATDAARARSPAR